ncbi:MAG: hypothetical protein ACRDS9_14690 [Pseudonocardiaceae bacterium]
MIIDATEKQAPSEVACNGNGADHHPAWCSTEEEHCFVTDDGVQVHGQAPVRWEDKAAGLRVETRLIDLGDALSAYVELCVTSLMFKHRHVYALVPVAAARRLCDQLTAHLAAPGTSGMEWLG